MAGSIAVRVICGSSGATLCSAEVTASDQVLVLKDLIEQQQGTPAEEQELLLGGEQLQDASTLGSAVRRIVAVHRAGGSWEEGDDDDDEEEDLVLECLDVTLRRRRAQAEGSPGRPTGAGSADASEPAARCAAGKADSTCEGRAGRLARLRAWAEGARTVWEGGAVHHTLAEGSHVRFAGCKGAVHLNGREGIVRAVDRDACRYSVEMEGPGPARTVRIRSQHLTLMRALDAPSFSAGSDSFAHESPLAFAVRTSDVFQTHALLRDGADPNSLGSMGRPLLDDAIDRGELAVVALLLGKRADPGRRPAELPQGAPHESFEGLVASLRDLFRTRAPPTREQRTVLESLDPGVLALVRSELRLPGAAAQARGLTPAACLRGQHVIEYPPAEAHRVDLHYADAARPLLVLRPLQRVTGIVVLLHGLHQSGPMLERLARELSWALPEALLLAPTAPTISSLSPGPAWFDPYGEPEEMLRQLEAASTEVMGLVKERRLGGVPTGRTALLGFSLGATLAAWTALQSPECLAGLALLSAPEIPEELRLALPPGEYAERPPVLLCHGSGDAIAPPAGALAVGDWLRGLDCPVEAFLYDGWGHTLSQSMLATVQLWVSERLS